MRFKLEGSYTDTVMRQDSIIQTHCLNKLFELTALLWVGSHFRSVINSCCDSQRDLTDYTLIPDSSWLSVFHDVLGKKEVLGTDFQ